MRRYKVAAFMVIVILTAVLTYISINNTNQKVYKNLRPGNKENSGIYSYGLYYKNGDLIDYNEVIKRPKDNNLELVLSLSHFFDKKGDYGLIILKDFNQTKFRVNQNEYTLYNFSVQPNSTINIKTEFKIDKSTKEITYILIKKPNFFQEDKDVRTSIFLGDTLVLRNSIENEDISSYKYDYMEPLARTNRELITGVFNSTEIENLKIIFQAKPNEDFYLSVGNKQNEEVTFAVVAFANWKQVPVIGDENVAFAQVAPGERQVFQMQTPNVNEITNYQIIGFPNPFRSEVRSKFPTSDSTHRIVIKPN